MTSQTFNLDLIPQGVPPIVHVSQYDKGQTWNIHIYENGVVFPVPSGTSAAVQGTKPDNTGFQYPAVISVGDNVVTFTVEQQMTVLGGQFECELVLVNGENQVATINFILDVEPTTLDDNTVISETELPLIEQAAELGAVINGYATQIHADAETASTAATAATAAADDATASKTAAATSASNAATSETNAAASATAAASSESNAATSETNAAASAAEAARLAATDMTGATASTAGTHGLVPAPAAGDDTKFLGGDGTWKDVPAELSGLEDVSISSVGNAQLLRYDATAGKWKNQIATATPIQNNALPIQSGAVYTALAGKQSTYAEDATQWDTTPTTNSAKPVTSGGVKAAVDGLSSQISNFENSFNWNTIDLSSSPTDYYSNAVLKTAKDVVVRNRFGSQIVLTPFGDTVWTHFGNPTNNYVDVEYIFERSLGAVRVTVNSVYGWDPQYAHINAIKYR